MRFDVYCGMMFCHVIGSFRTVAYDVGVKFWQLGRWQMVSWNGKRFSITANIV